MSCGVSSIQSDRVLLTLDGISSSKERKKPGINKKTESYHIPHLL